jgi:hypothetical protein
MIVSYEEAPVELAGGEVVKRRNRPTASRSGLWSAASPNHDVAARRPPDDRARPARGDPEADILALADPMTAHGDGISGRANRVWSVEQNAPGWAVRMEGGPADRHAAIGRSVRRRRWHKQLDGPTALRRLHAAQNPLSTGRTVAARPTRTRRSTERCLILVGFYARNIAVPARRNRGRRRCWPASRSFTPSAARPVMCPRHVTGDASPDVHLRGQEIWPYTDLLLARHGRGIGRRAPGGSRQRPRVAHGAPVGNRADVDPSTGHLRSSCTMDVGRRSPRPSCGMMARPRRGAGTLLPSLSSDTQRGQNCSPS